MFVFDDITKYNLGLLHFTLELPNTDNDIPFLDTLVRITDNYVTTRFYAKETHSGHILPFDSHTTYKRKIATIKTERHRASRICNGNQDAMIQATNFLTKRFLNNGYPLHLINKHLNNLNNTNNSHNNNNWVHNTNANNNNNITNDNAKPIYLKFPFIDHKYEIAIQRILKTMPLNFNIKPIFISERPLKSLLKNTQKIPCIGNCICEGNKLCMNKNITYCIKCKECNESYIGETHRTFRTRLLEHTKNINSNVYRHFLNKHNNTNNIRDKISHSISGKQFQNTLHRKSYEKQQISLKQPEINIQNT